MGDDAEYYLEEQEKEKQFQESQRLAAEDQMTRNRIKREKAIEAEKKISPKKG